MAAPDPHWRVKTRPCPFYSQGRCLFADSCNFMHNVKLTAKSTDITSDDIYAKAMGLSHSRQGSSSWSGAERELSIRTSTRTDMSEGSIPPSRVNSPRSIRSPTRSPRLSGLLFALQDVIGPDDGGEDDDYDDSEDVHNFTPEEDSYLPNRPEVLTTPVSPANVGSTSQLPPELRVEGKDEAPFGHNLAVPETSPALLDVSFNPSSADVSTLSFLSDFPVPPFSLPSRDDPISSTPSRCSSRDSKRTSSSPSQQDSFDSGLADDWTSPPIPPLSPPRISGPNSTFDLLHSPFMSPMNRMKSPRFSATGCPPSPIFSAFTNTNQSKLSPPITPQRRDALHQDLDSPSDRDRVAEQEEQDVVSAANSPTPSSSSEENLTNAKIFVASPTPSVNQRPWPRDVFMTPTKSAFRDSPQPLQADLTITAVTEYNASFDASMADNTPLITKEELDRQSSRALFANFVSRFSLDTEDVIDLSENDGPSSGLAEALDRRLSRPIFNGSNPFFSSEEREANDCDGSALSSSDPLSPSSPIVRLRRASSPLEHDTIASMFRYYSEPSTAINSSGSSDTLVDPQPALVAAKQGAKVVESAVFTAPPASPSPLSASTRDEQRSTTSSPKSASATSYTSPSPSGSRNGERSTVASPTNAQTVEVSKKVPFGFRQSFALGEASASSLLKSRLTRENAPKRTPLAVNTDISRTSIFEHNNISSSKSSPIDPLPSAPSWMKPLRLSCVLNSPTYSVSSQPLSSSNYPRSHLTNLSEFMQAAASSHPSSVLSDHSFSNNRLFSSTRSSLIPEHIRNNLIPVHAISPLQLASDNDPIPSIEDVMQSAPPAGSRPWEHVRHRSIRTDHRVDEARRSSGLLSPRSEPPRRITRHDSDDNDIDDGDDNDAGDDDDAGDDEEEHTYRRPSAPATQTRPESGRPTSIARSARSISVSHPPSAPRSPVHVHTPRPELMFAIASDDVEAVTRVLASGEAGPNDQVGPQSALDFTLTNDGLKHKMDIMKVLLAYGANPVALGNDRQRSDRRESILPSEEAHTTSEVARLDEVLNPAVTYYLNRANATHVRQPASLIQETSFRTLSRIRYDIVGQDRALEQLYRVLSMHSQQTMINPLVVLCCGPSGHGKSLLARKFGYLLDVPTHTVNMTTLQSTHDLWQSHSMSPYEEPSSLTLAEFLMENEGKRCVVVLDEIEKTENERNLWSLLAPWELGRCSVDAGRRHIDVRKVIWIGTSNIGQDLVFEYHASRDDPEAIMSRQEYLELMALLRPRVSAHLGTSLLSRVTTVLPFVPFTEEEKLAIATEALGTLGGGLAAGLSSAEQEAIARRAILDYMPAEGVRSLQRAVSTQLLDAV